MNKILVSGLINIETTLQIDGFPIKYKPVRFPFFGINTTVSGVGYNLAKALRKLGNTPIFLALIGSDLSGNQVKATLEYEHIPSDFVLQHLRQTPQSVIVFDKKGKRFINTDLKDIQERTYPSGLFERALAECSLAVICNINFARPYLKPAKESGKLIATDVHTVAKLDDEYNSDFMRYADILFMSDEQLPAPPEEWVTELMAKYDAKIVVVGLGDKGALMAVREDKFMGRFPAVYTRPVVNTIGAGDALFAAFIHSYQRTKDPYESIKKAAFYASYKIGENGGAEGFLTDVQLDKLYEGKPIE
jgi:acarbose 7IV-phosphotransferase